MDRNSLSCAPQEIIEEMRSEARLCRNRELGDFQTPPELVEQILAALGPMGKQWPRVLEPTCGKGNFIEGLISLESPPREIRAFELQPEHIARASKLVERFPHIRTHISQANLFGLDLRRDLKWKESGPLLVIGNPPWVTNAEIGASGGDNLPVKTNLRGLNGIAAMTGESNFDIAEHIWIKLMRELAHEQPTIALLCKTSVARNVLRFAHETSFPVEEACIRKIPATRWFAASVDACLFFVKVGSTPQPIEAKVYPDLDAREPETVLGIRAGAIVDLSRYERAAFLEGVCPFSWRQGLKHDSASVMELAESGGSLLNRLGHEVLVEPQHVYPLLKGADVFRQEHPVPRKFVLVTQQRVGEDTEKLREEAPRLWSYLERNAAIFEKRRSSVFRKAPRFAMFGIGDYSFAPYKVAVAALYKTPRFRLVRPFRTRPVMLDDTCYFVACSLPAQAALLACLLNHPLCLDFIAAAGFSDAKRRVTKKLLSRIDLRALFRRVDGREFREKVRIEIGKSSPSCCENLDAAEVDFVELLQPPWVP